MIEFQQVRKLYGTKEALKGVNLRIEPGELVFIQGRSGAGKSTLLKLIAAIEPVTSGQIIFNRTSIQRLHKGAVPYYRRNLGLIFQDPMLLADRTVFENVMLPLELAGFDKEHSVRRVQAALHRVDLLDKIHDYPSMLSSGEQQRISIARAVIHKPKVLLADEPTGNLDPRLSMEIMDLFQKLQQVGVTVIIASHDTYLLEHFPFRKITIDKGQVFESKPSQQEERAYG